MERFGTGAYFSFWNLGSLNSFLSFDSIWLSRLFVGVVFALAYWYKSLVSVPSGGGSWAELSSRGTGTECWNGKGPGQGGCGSFSYCSFLGRNSEGAALESMVPVPMEKFNVEFVMLSSCVTLTDPDRR